MEFVDITRNKQGADFEMSSDLGDPHDWKLPNRAFLIRRFHSEEITLGGLHIPDKAQKDNYRAEIISIGEGIDTFVKPGDTVIIGADEEQAIYADVVRYKSEEYLFIKPVNVLCKVG